ncbi:HAD family hydrolase [Anaerotalea alkaliphila]|uniref:HAD family hydrolase n=1 Tax=Anaerotalea alkaliphila TaxID=2662126 RepID=A0A7X5KN14_9FIRM|nr:HAD family hydrolase [Anaerotalea alkaliphila]NDL67293.1 HAD family hydrolase [Anaerotalea alkaliphila]
MYNAVVFDVDGTLLDTEKAALSGLQAVLEQLHGIKVAVEDLGFCMGMTGQQVFEHFGIKDYQRSYEAWVDSIQASLDRIRLFDGIRETLDFLKGADKKLAIVTSKTRREFEETMAHFGIVQYFDTVVCSDEVERPKPDKEPLLKAIQFLQEEPESTLYIGDTLQDIRCAKSAQVDFGLALWGANRELLQHCSTWLCNPTDIICLLHNECL